MPVDCPVRQTASPAPTLSIDPPADRWASLLKHNTSPEAIAFREQLGLPTDRPIVMSGHQAQIWHPGILSKYLSTISAGNALGAHPAWVVVDQDTGEPTRLRFATTEDDGTRRAGERDLAPSQRHAPDTPLGLRPPATISATDPSPLQSIAGAMRRHQDAPSLSAQVQRALEDLLEPIAQPVQTVSALAINSTDLFATIVERMRTDPAACARAYNDAVRKHPGARVRPMRTDDASTGAELPLWRIAGDERTPVFASDLEGTPVEAMAPRGLLMTGLVRRAGCDLFIHGTGGGVYDRITDAWFERWLGKAPHAPSAVVTATLTPGGEVDTTIVDEADRLAWRAQSARHNPELLGDDKADARKRELIEQIRGSDAQRARELYRELHALLEQYRAAHESELASIDARAQAARERAAPARANAQIARDRTLPFPLYARDDLLTLRSLVRGAFMPADG